MLQTAFPGCLPTNGDVKRYFFHIFKNQNNTTNDAVNQTIKAVIEIRNSYKKVDGCIQNNF